MVSLLEGLEARSPVLAGEDGLVAKLLLDTQKLVVLAKTLRAAWGTSLDLTSLQADDQISDKGVLSLARSVGNHDAPLGREGHLSGLSFRCRLYFYRTSNQIEHTCT